MVQSVSVAPASANIQSGRTVDLTAGVTQQNCGTLPVTWTSSAPNVASVSSTGRVAGLATGTATVTASAGGRSGDAAITVVAGPVFSIAITPANPTVAERATLQLNTTLRDSLGNAATGSVTWATSDATVATVSGAGLVTGVKSGSATITASAGGKAATATLTVTGPLAATLTLSPGPRTVDAGTTLLVEARPMDASGAPVNRPVTFTVSNPAIAGVVTSANNVASVELLSTGTVSVAASLDGQTAGLALTVVARRPRFAYAYVNDSASSLAPQAFDTTDHAFNSSGGQVVVQRRQGGTWRIIFPGLRLDAPGEPILPLVRPMGVSVGQCGTSSRGSGPFNQTFGDVYFVDVSCTGAGGGPLTRPFLVAVFGSNYSTIPWAFTEVVDSVGGTTTNTFVPGAGTATGTRLAGDVYRLQMSPVPAGNDVWHALSLSPGLTCGVLQVIGAGTTRGVEQDCTNVNSGRARSRNGLFVLLNGRAAMPRADAMVSESGVVTASPSATAPTVSRLSAGVYRVRVAPPGLATTRFPAVIVTGVRNPSAASVGCRVVTLTRPIPATVEARVECRDGGAGLRDNAFAVSAIY
ncbi:MAG: Ig domain-containing protein [Gemmatimonadaceae bacterium]|nr:Ig domain-containing protein [Gemmatimonadaceae bacterium]